MSKQRVFFRIPNIPNKVTFNLREFQSRISITKFDAFRKKNILNDTVY